MKVPFRDHMWRWILGCLLVSLPTACRNSITAAAIREASGIVCNGREVHFVVDPDPGAYYTMPIPTPQEGPGFSLEPSRVRRTFWPEAKLGLDPESIEILADERIVLLSERLHALVSRGGLVADYDEPLSSVGKRGLEGLAVRPLPGGASAVAVLWEGGYPSKPNLPEFLGDLAAVDLPPYLLTHRLERGETGVAVKLDEKPGDSSRRIGTLIKLDVPKPPGYNRLAHRFRAPDLVWHKTADGEWGFIVLLSSHNSPEEGKREKYTYLELRQFSAEGKALGERIDLTSELPEELRWRNWEGLDWYVEGKSLILVHESEVEDQAPKVYILELEPEWQWK